MMGSNKKAAVVVVELPEELQEEILSRIPLQHLIRCKSVCKTWLHLISSQYMIQLHLKKSISRPTHLQKLLLVSYKTLGFPKKVIPYADIIDLQTMVSKHKQIQFPRPSYGSHMGFLGTCDGLLCLFNEEHCNFHIWNPTTQVLQAIHIKTHLLQHKCSWFGREDNEYILVIGTKSHMHLIKPYLDFNYSFKSTQEFEKIYHYYHEMGTLFKGTVHWPANGRSLERSHTVYRTIVSYNLRQEMIGEIPVPEEEIPILQEQMMDERYGFVGFTLGEVNGCLTAMFRCGQDFTLWAMKEYGVRNSWNKLMIYCGVNEYHRMVQVKDEIVLLYNSETISSPPYDHVMLFVESRVCPTKHRNPKNACGYDCIKCIK